VSFDLQQLLNENLYLKMALGYVSERPTVVIYSGKDKYYETSLFCVPL
jgi:hypothetical protein